MNLLNSVTISELRRNVAQVMKNMVREKTPYVIMQRSKPKAVLVEYDYYNALEEAVLDLTDSREADRAKSEPKDDFLKYYQQRWDKKPK